MGNNSRVLAVTQVPIICHAIFSMLFSSLICTVFYIHIVWPGYYIFELSEFEISIWTTFSSLLLVSNIFILFIENLLNTTKKSPRAPVEQHSFKGVLRKNSPQPNPSSPSNTKKAQEPMQMDFRNVLTNRVTTNQHKTKSPPLVAVKPAVNSKRE